MNKVKLSILVCLLYQFSMAQCDIKTTNRPDGNTMKYFNPKPVIRQSDYEVGISIYKNITTNVLMINASFLFKGKNPEKLTGNLVIQTTNKKGISLKPLVSELVEMNGRDVAICLYEIDDITFYELSKYALKSIFVYVGGNLVGANVSENTTILKTEINCLK